MDYPKIAIGSQVIRQVTVCYRAKLPLMLRGRHGIGKSEVLEQAARELGIHFILFDLSIVEPVELTGLPRIDNEVTKYHPPERLPREGKGLLALEELNRAPRDTRASCYQLLTARRLNDYVLPDGWLVVSSTNPHDDNYEVYDLDSALMSRFLAVNAIVNRQEWLRWAKANSVHARVVAYIESDPSAFEHPDSNPRAWTNVSKYLNAAEIIGLPHIEIRTGVGGIVGTTRSAAFFKFLTSSATPLRAEDVLAYYDRHRKTVQGWAADGKLDLARATLGNVLSHLQARDNFTAARQSRRARRNLAHLFDDLPADFRPIARKTLADCGHRIPRWLK